MMPFFASQTIAFLALVCIGAAALHDGQIVLSGIDDMIEVHEKLSQARIIPEVVYDFEPIFGLAASWKTESASLGNILDPPELQSSPSVHLEKAEDEGITKAGLTFVLTMTDPDAPSHDNPKWSEFCHWIATGLAAPSHARSPSEFADLIEYRPPGPPPKTGMHRYVFLVFVPANGTTETLHLSKPSTRQHWGFGDKGHGVQDWARGNGLVPVAANFIYAQNKEQ